MKTSEEDTYETDIDLQLQQQKWNVSLFQTKVQHKNKWNRRHLKSTMSAFWILPTLPSSYKFVFLSISFTHHTSSVCCFKTHMSQFSLCRAINRPAILLSYRWDEMDFNGKDRGRVEKQMQDIFRGLRKEGLFLCDRYFQFKTMKPFFSVNMLEQRA